MTVCTCDYDYRMEITIDNANVTANLTYFPILVHASLPTANVSSPSAWDVVFFLDQSGTCSALRHDIHDYNGATGDYWAWVLIPQLDSAAPMTLWMHYGKSGADINPSDSKVWTHAGYKSVWHMSDASAPLGDSANFQNGAEQGAPTYQQPGKIDRCVEFDEGNPDHFDISNNEWQFDQNSNFTIEIWLKLNENELDRYWAIVDSTDNKPRVILYFIPSNGDGFFEFDVIQGGGIEALVSGNGGRVTNTWYHVVCRQDYPGTGLSMFVDGIKQTDTEAIPAYDLSIGMGNFVARIGAGCNLDFPFDGFASEMRICSTNSKSDNWIWQTWRVANDPATFAALGAEQSVATLEECSGLFCEEWCCESSCGTFWIRGDSYTLCWNVPSWNSADKTYNRNVKRFTFWTDDFSVEDDSKNSEPVILRGVEYYREECEGTDAIPTNYSIWWRFYCKFNYLDEMVNSDEKLQIYGINDCTDGYYAVRRFSYKTIRGAPHALEWELHLEFDRELTDAEKAAF